MISLIQLVTHANVDVDGASVGAIKQGILALIGIEKNDNETVADKMFDKIMNYRIFPDALGKTNLSLKDTNGGLLLVPQFTLVADTGKGLRPSFSSGMRPDEGERLFAFLVDHAKENYAHVASGKFGAHMKVTLCNDGPMTFLLTVK